MPEDVAAREVLEDARALAASGEWAKLVALVTSLHPADLAELVLDLSEETRRDLLGRLPSDVVGQLFEYVEDDELRDLIRGVGVEDLPAVLEEVEDDVAADVIQQLEPAEQVETLAALDRGEEVAELMAYGDESAGGLMSRGFVALNDDITVLQAIDYLRVLRPSAERAYYLYVLDRAGRLQGVVSIRDLLVSAPETRLGEITQRDVHAVATGTDQEEAARVLQKYNLMALPVVDEDGRLEGIMTADDLIDVLQEEATEDMYRMAGVGEDERVFSPVRTSVRRRLPWMMGNVLTAFLAAVVVGLFDSALSKAAVLAYFMPVVAGMGGNAGTQTATIAVRSIALGDLDVGDVFRACRKEILVAMANGLAIGLVAALGAYIWQRNETLSLVLGCALFLNICAATLAGVLIPLGLKAVKVDPALAANIFVTAITDVMGFVFFLGIASLVISRIQ
ncbi:magnesium transporter [Candidatus Amarobacter glycogenicus]|uniref:magnesium transporter n=1 Tax=Candidatus Amarobacter glycogenicus TaxID=3140699 RepID=UPI002A0CBC9D|nr:magnesium transporter [Dehalococcoidia bacterium]MBK9613540.1 magnesium transporter [Dehalococcoidia bacterium]